MSGLSKPNPTPGSFKAFVPTSLAETKAVAAPTVQALTKKDKVHVLAWLWPFGKKDKA